MSLPGGSVFWATDSALHRMHRGLSHRTLRKMLGVDSGSLSRWETGQRRPDKRSRGLIDRFLRDSDSLAADGHASSRG